MTATAEPPTLAGVNVVSHRSELVPALSGLGPCAFVPTMGALHEGHATLLRKGVLLASERNLAGGCVASIFVNPSQFNDPADFARYPKTPEADLAMCERAGCTLVYAPAVEDIYPPHEQIIAPPLPAVATEPGLEDAHRPGHFAGVCRVVKRLFDLVSPRLALFGEKDWQQFQIIRAMTQQQELSIDVLGVPTVRERDGLAMSSRNRFLSPQDRARGLAISRALQAALAAANADEGETLMGRVLADAGIAPEYAVIREASGLLAPTPGKECRALIAAKVGSVRLIDNAAWQPASA